MRETTAVVRLGPRHDVLDIGLPAVCGARARVRPEHQAAQTVDDPSLDRLRVAVVVRVVGRTAPLRGDLDAPVRFRGRRRGQDRGERRRYQCTDSASAQAVTCNER